MEYQSDHGDRTHDWGDGTMAVAQRTVLQPTRRGWAAAVVLAAMFGTGLLTGLVIPRIAQPGPPVAAAVQAGASGPAEPAYLTYRSGERGDALATRPASDLAWTSYRAGERDALVGLPTAAQAWQTYRAGERNDRPAR